MQSPGVLTREFDTTISSQSTTSPASATVGLFRWGPVDYPVSIENESQLVEKFFQPDDTTSVSFHSVQNYLLYTSPLYVVRSLDKTVAKNAVPTAEIATLVENVDKYEAATLTGISFIAKYPGVLGNALKVSAADSTNYSTWAYADEFDFTPAAGEFNMVVVDETGEISGTVGTVIEKFEIVSKTVGAKKPDGSTAYIKDVLKDQSNWVLVGDVAEIVFSATGSLGVYEVSFQGGIDGSTGTDFADAVATLANNESISIVCMFASALDSVNKAAVIDLAETRADCIAFVAPELNDVQNATDPVTNLTGFYNTTLNKNTSYGFAVDNWKLVYDKYNDKNVWIPCDSDAAALYARLFTDSEAWYSMAGFNRGRLKNVIRLAYSATKSQRDTLYKSGINSIVNFEGEGHVLFGDKTLLKRPSYFNRINVRSLFNVLKKDIARAARYQLFEQNDFISRSIFRNSADQRLAQVQARRGVLDYRVICDETNNTGVGINDFVGDIYIKPIGSINYITLNFVAVDQTVSFEEIEGTV